MQNETIFQLLSEKVVFQGIAVRDFKKGIFCGLFDINGTPFIMDHLTFSENENKVWDVSGSKVYHYSDRFDSEEEHHCPFCKGHYESGKTLSPELLCGELNTEPYLTALWGSCLMSETFNATFHELLMQLNPMGMKSKKRA